MPWTLAEKHGKEAAKLALLAGGAVIAGTVLLAAWLTWDTWVSVREGALPVAAAKRAYQTMIALVLVLAALAAVRRRGSAPRQPGINHLEVWAAVAFLVCAAMPTVALLALPAG